MAFGFFVALLGLSSVLSPRIQTDAYLKFTPIALLVGVLGFALVGYSIRGLFRSVLAVFLPRAPEELAEVYVQNRSLLRGPRIVVLGGGTGMPVLLRGLKAYTANLTAIVTSADDGGSSGRLRKDLGVLPPGDVRNCLLALAATEPLLEKLFQYRFDRGEGLEGHAFGNLFLAAMERITGDFQEAIVQSSHVLAVQGKVLAATRQPITLLAQMENGTWIRGESAIPRSGQAIKTIRLEPQDPRTSTEVVQALKDAEAIVIAPGSLWTSILPVLIVPRVREALGVASGVKIYVQNLMTQPGETDHMTAADHVRTIDEHVPGITRWVVVNGTPIDPTVLERYKSRGAFPIATDENSLRARGKDVLTTDLIAPGRFVRHDSDKLARAVLQIVLKEASGFDPRRRLDLFFLGERLKSRKRKGA